MPRPIIAAAWRRVVSYPHTKLTLLYLAEHAAVDSWTLTTSMQAIAEACAQSVRSVNDDLHSLSGKGDIRILERRRRRRPGDRVARVWITVRVFPQDEPAATA
jgi:hypothetical protein